MLFNYKESRGFTLAEVLITLGIIGVVAAITIPSLMTAYNKHVIETKLFKIHSTVMQAVKMAQANNGGAIDLNDVPTEAGNVNGFSRAKSKAVFDEYFAPVFTSATEYHPTVLRNVYSADGSTRLEAGDGATYLFQLNDGTVLGFTKSGNNDTFYIDVVFNAGKNKIRSGKDTFWLKYENDGTGGYKYTVHGDYNEQQFKSYCVSNSQRPAASIYPSAFCTALIAKNNFKIPKDYPVKL